MNVVGRWKGLVTSGSLSMEAEILIYENPITGMKSFSGIGKSRDNWLGTEITEEFTTNIGNISLIICPPYKMNDEFYYRIDGSSAAGPILEI